MAQSHRNGTSKRSNANCRQNPALTFKGVCSPKNQRYKPVFPLHIKDIVVTLQFLPAKVFLCRWKTAINKQPPGIESRNDCYFYTAFDSVHRRFCSAKTSPQWFKLWLFWKNHTWKRKNALQHLTGGKFLDIILRHRGVAKFGIALGSGPRDLGFESRHFDQIRLIVFDTRVSKAINLIF